MNEPDTSSCRKEILYLYCFAVSKDLPDIQGAGIDDQYPLFLSRVNRVTAVLSHAALDDFTGEKGADNLQDIDWIGPRACRHQDVISQVMEQSPVLPVRFATLYLSDDSLNRMMLFHHEAVATFLNEIAGKEEWAVKGYMDRKPLLKSIGADLITQLSEGPGTREHSPGEQEPGEPGSKRIDRMAPGTMYFQKKKIEQKAETLVNESIQQLIMTIADRLEPLSIDINERQLMSRAATGKEIDMVLNWAALLDKKSVHQFNDQIEQINADKEKNGLVLEFSGPWPPYSFCPAIGMEKDI